MKRAWNVARREIGTFFDHPTAYILVVAFLSLGLFLTFRTLYAAGIATMRPFFDMLPWLFAIFIPAMTMRSLAEERRSGTLEWLLAHPLGEAEVIAGKFIGNWIFALIALAGSVPTAAGLLMVSEADAGIMAAQYIGAGLLAALGVAVGLWASSLTRNQITAFMVAASVSFFLVLIGTPVVLIGLPPALGAAVSRLSVIGHFTNVARGVVDLRDIIYFLSTTALFLVLATGLLSRERLALGRGAYRRLRIGTAALAAVVVVVNLLGGNIRGRLDLTSGGLYTLSDGTRAILGELDDIVTLKLVVSDELPTELVPSLRDVRDLVSDLRRAARGQLIVENLNPDDDEDVAAEARALGVTQNEFNILRDDEFEVRRGWFGLALLYADEREVIPYIARTDDLEFRILSSISSMTTEVKPRVTFLTGFGAESATTYPSLRQGLVDRYEIGRADLSGDTIPELDPDTLDIIVLAGPDQTMSDESIQRVRSYVEGGGAALLLLDNNQVSPQSPITSPVSTGLEGFLEENGIRMDAGMAMDYSSNSTISMGRQGIFNLVRPYPLWPIAFKGDDHPTTRDLSNLTVGWATAITVTDSAAVRRLWVTSEAGYVQPSGGMIMPEALPEPDPDDLRTVTLAVALDARVAEDGGAEDGGAEDGGAEDGEAEDGEAAKIGRMIVVGDVDFLQEQFIRSNPQNLIFAANAIDWLAQDEALIGIRSKTRTPPAMSFTSDFQKTALKWGNLVGVPLLFVLAGTVRVTGRRRRAEARWEEMTR